MRALNGMGGRCALVALFSLAGCSLPPVDNLPPREEVVSRTQAHLETEGAPAVIEVPVGRGMLVARSVRERLPSTIAARRISVSFPAGEATLERLATMVSVAGIRTVTRFETNSDTDMLRRPLPFRAFSGTFGELANVLESGMGVVSWWQNGTLFLTDRDRFAFTVPQNMAVIESITADLKSLGAVDITQSLRGGQIVFTAPPSLYAEVIRPYIDRIHRNMAMIKVQVAVVTVSITDQSASGFDWSAFSLQFNSRNEPAATPSRPAGNANPISVNIVEAGKILGVSGVFNVASAISFLSRFGNADTRQNAEVHTLSGTEVVLRSGQTIPYVSGVGVNTIANAGTTGALLGSAQTSTVDTGLTLRLTPLFDADSRLVTIALNVLVNSVLEFRELSAGNQVGTFTQPVTQEQALNDIVRVQAGNTVVLGGLQIDGATFAGNDATQLRQIAGGAPTGLGRQAQDVRREALFIILRPTVTVFHEGSG